jgi:hypothetical protein
MASFVFTLAKRLSLTASVLTLDVTERYPSAAMIVSHGSSRRRR